MKRIILVFVLIISSITNAKDPAIKEILINGEDYVCRPSNMKVNCPTTDMSISMSMIANFADAVTCTNSIQGKSETLIQDQQIAKECFAGPKIQRVSTTLSRLMLNKECINLFNNKCAESFKCSERDVVFGGFKTKCGNVGEYIDLLTRVKGLSEEIFTEADGQNLCNNLF